ncbi:hypothetical protein CWE15_03675 [Aliidiomarina taiwanensis]|uniref:Cellulose biosynthesis protein BcsE n=1 Tax=Aliidiomarina taiwanensis TaxID=946228 RepID=A0A432XAD4_9GAMM|nr:BcsE family c-di-GMP-binding protein [Aliidiomarina taiwanensis]RUO44280.1 hypothetical protein CWE15_03675 [Aliidiomarina taiwanensis]
MIELNSIVTSSDDVQLPKLSENESHCIILESQDWVFHTVHALASKANIAMYCNASLVRRMTEKNSSLLTSDHVQIAEWKFNRFFNVKKAISAIERTSTHSPIVFLVLDIENPSRYESLFMRNSLMKQLTSWAYNANKILIVGLFGQMESEQTQTFLADNARHFMSLNFIYQQLSDIHWKASFWLSGYTVNQWDWVVTPFENEQGSLRFKLSDIQENEALAPLLGLKAPKYVMKNALKMGEALPEGWRMMDTNEGLKESIAPGSDALIVLSLSSKEAFFELANHIFKLRKHYGAYLRIVVRSFTDAIRLQDEEALVYAGATMVLPREISFQRMLNLAKNTAGSTYSHSLPKDLSQLHIGLQNPNLKGYLAPKGFLQAVRSLTVQAQRQDTPAALVRASIATGLTKEAIVNRFTSRRTGDMITFMDDAVFIFLTGCKPSELEYTLDMSFGLPTQTIFSQQISTTQHLQILDDCDELQITENVSPSAIINIERKQVNAVAAAHSAAEKAQLSSVRKVSFL